MKLAVSSDADIICQFSSNGTNGHYFGNQTTASDQVMDTTNICQSAQANDDVLITISATDSTSFTILYDINDGTLTSATIEMIVMGY